MTTEAAAGSPEPSARQRLKRSLGGCCQPIRRMAGAAAAAHKRQSTAVRQRGVSQASASAVHVHVVGPARQCTLKTALVRRLSCRNARSPPRPRLAGRGGRTLLPHLPRATQVGVSASRPRNRDDSRRSATYPGGRIDKGLVGCAELAGRRVGGRRIWLEGRAVLLEQKGTRRRITLAAIEGVRTLDAGQRSVEIALWGSEGAPGPVFVLEGRDADQALRLVEVVNRARSESAPPGGGGGPGAGVVRGPLSRP